MFGTVARVTVKPGKGEELLALAKEWTQAQASHSGQIAEYIFKLENRPDEYLTIGIFPSREGYRDFASEPETDHWYRRMRELLVADPEWNDGEVVVSEVLARI